jgi:membrane-associated protease RseP (regulator of RpoE activity)
LTTKAGKDVRVAFSQLSTEDQNYVLEADAKRQDAPAIGQLEVVALASGVIRIFEEKKFPLPQHREGLLVNEVPNGSPASVAGLRNVDIIHAIDDIPIKTVEDYVWATRGMKTGQSYRIFIERISENTQWEEKVLTVVPLTRSEVTKAIKNAPPLKLAGGVLENSIGVPVVKIGGQNLTDKAIVAFVVELQCFDRFEKPVLGSGGIKSNKVPAICQETIKAKAAFVGADDLRTITLNGHETATVIKIYLKKVKFEDGSEWNSDDGVYMDSATSSK